MAGHQEFYLQRNNFLSLLRMKIIKEILGRLFATWASVTFIVTFFIIFIPAMFCWLIPEPKGQDIFIKISRLWMNIWLPIAGCPIKITGKENFVRGSIYIVICNHNSLMDVPLSCPFIPGPNKTIAKSSFAKIPLFGFFYRKGSVLVDRKSEESRRQSYEKMKAVLTKRMHMCIYPEGTRNKTKEPLQRFHDGAFRLAVNTNHSILPAIIFNTANILPNNKTFYFWPGKIEMHFLPPVDPSSQTVEQLKEKVFSIMKDHYVQNNRS